MFLNRGEGKWRYMPNMNVHQMVGSVKYFKNKVGKIPILEIPVRLFS